MPRQATRTPPRPPARPCWPSAPASASMTWPSSSAPAGSPAADALAAGGPAGVARGPSPQRCRWPTSAGSRRPRCPATPPSSARWPSAASGVLVFLGRTHLYEGHPVATVVHGVRTAMAAGCRVVVLTNAAGGIRRGLPGRAAGPDPRPPQPDRPLPAGRPASPGRLPAPVHRPHRPVLAAAARPGPRRRPRPGRGRLRGAAGTALRDPGRDRHAARARRRPGRHVHRP